MSTVLNCRLWTGLSGQGIGLNTWDTVGVSFDGRLQYATAFDQIFRSQNSGFNWSQINSPFTGLKYNDLAVSYSGDVIVLTNNINLFISENSGNSWRTGVIPNQNNKLWNKVSISKNADVIATAGLNSNIFVSHNTGYNWFSGLGTNSLNWSAISISANGGQYQTAGISGNTLWISEDSGVNWKINSVGKSYFNINDPLYSNISLLLPLTGGINNYIDLSQHNAPINATTGIQITGINIDTQKDLPSPISNLYTFISGYEYYDFENFINYLNPEWIDLQNNNGQFNFFNNDFTIEFFYKFYKLDQEFNILNAFPNNPNQNFGWDITQFQNTIRWRAFNNIDVFSIYTTTLKNIVKIPEADPGYISDNWYHIAFSKSQSDNTMYAFINGVLANTGLERNTFKDIQKIRIGSISTSDPCAYCVNPIFGLCGLQITSGIAKYKDNFIPPGFPSNIQSENWQDIKLSENGDSQIAVSDKNVFLSKNQGLDWKRFNVQSWPTNSFNQQYLTSGAILWSPNTNKKFASISSIVNFDNISGQLAIEGYFDTGYLNFDWALIRSKGGLVQNGVQLRNELLFKATDLLNEKYYDKFFTFYDQSRTLNLDLSNWNPRNYNGSFLSNSYYIKTPSKYKFEWSYNYNDVYTYLRTSSQDSGCLSNVLLPKPLTSEKIKDLLKDRIDIVDFDIPNPTTSTLYISNNSGVVWKSLDFSGINKFKFSENGKHQIIVGKFLYTPIGGYSPSTINAPFISNNYGYSWVTGAIPWDSNTTFQDCVISNNGSVATIVGNRGYNTQNGGISWTDLNIFNIVSIAASFDAQYQILAQNQGNLFFSQNYGVSFNSISNTFKNWQNVAISTNGQFITALTKDEYIYTISNLNLNSFSSKLNDKNRNWNNVSISPNGQYQAAVEKNGNLFISVDYGANWTEKDNIYNINYAAMTDDGEIFIVNKLGCAYKSLDLGNTWVKFLNQNSVWKEIQISKNKQVIGAYFNNLKELNMEKFALINSVSGISLQSNINSSGYGSINLNSFTGNLFMGDILVTGKLFQPGVHVVTGLLTGEINEEGGEYYDGTFIWNVNLTSTGKNNETYLDSISGFKQARNSIDFIDSTGSGLKFNDNIQFIDYFKNNNAEDDFEEYYGINFFYNPSPTNIFQFSSPQYLINLLNSGALGLLGNYSQGLGVTGYLVGSTLELFSLGRIGKDGNNLMVYRDTDDARSIKIKNRYFTGGETYRAPAEKWTGIFRTNTNLRIANSGYYNNTIDIYNVQNIQDVVWEDNFSNWRVLTGLKAVGLVFTGDLYPINYNNNLNLFSGSIIMNKANSMIDPLSGFIIDIQKPRPYYITGNYAKYEISFNNLIYTGILEG
jgi:photosystem II stability/assembly factor-like uncharacterized protein